MKRASVRKPRPARVLDDGIDVDRATARRDPTNYETLITSDPISVSEVKKKIASIRKKYPHLTKHMALQLLIYRASAEVSMVVSNSDGGGRYARYCHEIGVRY
jgi:hypothetical protein